jgi:hypothetical protein
MAARKNFCYSLGRIECRDNPMSPSSFYSYTALAELSAKNGIICSKRFYVSLTNPNPHLFAEATAT